MQKLTTGVDFLNEYRARALTEMPLLGRNRELSKLEAAVGSNSPALIEGSPGLGKTRLLLELRRRLSNGNESALYVRFTQPLHAFLVNFAEALSRSSADASSVALRGTIWGALESNPRVILVDNIADAGPLYYRFFERIHAAKGNVLVGSTCQIHRLGSLQRVFWNPQTIVRLNPLNKQDAIALVASAIRTFLPHSRISPEFASRVAQAARGNPGRIVDICVRATNSAYWDSEARIRFEALLMDSLAGSLP